MKKVFNNNPSLLGALLLLFKESKKRQPVSTTSTLEADAASVVVPELIKVEADLVNPVYKFPMVTPGLEAKLTITGQNSHNHAEETAGTNVEISNSSFLKNDPTMTSTVTETEDWVSFKLDIHDTGIKPEIPKKSNFKISLNNLF